MASFISLDSAESQTFGYAESHPKDPQPNTPVILFIHGAESSKETWKRNFEALKKHYHLYALDLRGHGDSSLGNPASFTFDQIVRDVEQFVSKMRLDSFVLVSHSMGARVATCFAAEHPNLVKTLVIEDMEMIPREREEIDEERLSLLQRFPSETESIEEAVHLLKGYGFTAEKIESLVEQGKIRAIPGAPKVHIGVNPYVTHLAKNEISASKAAECAFRKLKDHPFPVYLFIADRESSVSKEGKELMQSQHPNLEITHFPGSDHRIHKTTCKEYNEKLIVVVNKAN